MPLTFPSHLAPVLPLKLWRPRWFDGVALATGTVAPDVSYLAIGPNGQPFVDTHAWQALFWWCIPVALAYAWVFRSFIGTIAAHLPDSSRFTWRAYGVLARNLHRWWITVLSALVGAVSHVVWDWLTHTDGWLLDLFGVRWSDVTTVAWWTVSDLTSSVMGSVSVIFILSRKGRQPMERVGGCPMQSADVRLKLFWLTAGAVTAAGLSAAMFLYADPIAATGVRMLHVAALALIAGSLAVRTRVKPSRRTASDGHPSGDSGSGMGRSQMP